MGLFSKKKKKHDVEWIDMRMIEIKLNCPRVPPNSLFTSVEEISDRYIKAYKREHKKKEKKSTPSNSNKEIISTEDVRYSLCFDLEEPETTSSISEKLHSNYELFKYEKWVERQGQEPTFQELLLDYIDRRYYTNPEFYKAAHMDRKLFSTINKDKDYHPSKKTAVACCLALKLCIGDSIMLIARAGYNLSLSITWDRVIYYCIENEIYDIDTVNELLYNMGEECI